MATLTANEPRPYEIGDRNEFPVIAGDIIYEGAAVGVVPGTGHAQPLTSSDRFEGFAEKQADNSSGAAAAINVRVIRKGSVKLAVSGAVITDVGNPVYATDDNTFVFVPTSGVFIGFVRKWVSSGYVIVEFNADLFEDPHAGYVAQTVTGDLVLDAQDSGKVLCVTATAVLALPSVEGLSNIRCLNCGAFGTVQVTVDPELIDMVEIADIAGADSRGMVNTLITARRGDFIDVDYSDAHGYVVTKKKGTWAKSAAVLSSSVSPSISPSVSPSISPSPSPS